MDGVAGSEERERREAIWADLLSRGSADAVPPEVLAAAGIRPLRTGQGVFRDSDRTTAVAPPYGVTLSLLDVGSTYDDAFDEDGGLYHYPTTLRKGRDEPEIEATKNVQRLGVPVFVILRGPDGRHRRVRRAWVADWDDAARVFFITFLEPQLQAPAVEPAFTLAGPRRSARPTTTIPRPGQARFKFDVVKRYGAKCALCQVAVPQLLEAVHICPVADGGTDDARNGLVLCRNHHRAFDEHLFGLEPSTHAVVASTDGPTPDALGILMSDLAHLPATPHDEALRWRWDVWRTKTDIARP